MTEFNEVFQYFLNSLSNDYRIKKLFETNIELAEDMLTIWLLKAITEFDGCKQNIYDIDETNKKFNFVLGLKEKIILSELMVLVWMNWNINNITQMNLGLNDLDFKRYSEQRNLSGKVAAANNLREQIQHKISQYQLDSLI